MWLIQREMMAYLTGSVLENLDDEMRAVVQIETLLFHLMGMEVLEAQQQTKILLFLFQPIFGSMDLQRRDMILVDGVLLQRVL